MRWPGRSAAGLLRLLACTIAFAGTPYLRARLSTVSPEPTWMAVPPSQFHAGCDWRGTQPGRSRAGGGGNGACTAAGADAGAIAGLYDPRPCPPPDTPADATVVGRLALGG